jgi:hypothetical protein
LRHSFACWPRSLRASADARQSLQASGQEGRVVVVLFGYIDGMLGSLQSVIKATWAVNTRQTFQ